MTHTFREARYLTRAVTSRAAEAASEFPPCMRFVRRGSYRWPSLARWISPTASTGELPLPAAASPSCPAIYWASLNGLPHGQSSAAVSAAVSTGNSSDRIESIADAHRFTSTDRPRCRAEPRTAAAALLTCAPLVACPEFGHDVMGRCRRMPRLWAGSGWHVRCIAFSPPAAQGPGIGI
jgi:hypothetical protein